MRITNLEKGEDYNLKPDTKIEVERTNPFFNEYGELTTPLELPASERNRRLLGFPDSFGRRVKMQTAEAVIQDGEYFAQCRQMVLSAQYKGSITTSFYLNDGSFYSRIQSVRLKDIFADETIPVPHTSGNSDVEDCIQFCRSLRANNHPQYGIFPIIVEDDSGIDSGYNYKVINAYGKDRTLRSQNIWIWKNGRYEQVNVATLKAFDPNLSGNGCDFYNAVQRTEHVGEVPITLAPGYYITPFIRANYVLQRIFAHFGYELQANFFTRTEPFDKMVVLNRVIDTLVNGKIKVADLVPDVTCSDFIAVFRRKFCCEFTSDEGKRTADIIFLREALAAEPVEDLTRCMTSEPVIAYKDIKAYQRITLGSDEKVSTEISDSYDDLSAMAAANPTAYFYPVDGAFYKTGYSGDLVVTTKVGEASQGYNTGGELEAKEIKVPDLMPEFRKLYYQTMVDGEKVTSDLGSYLFVGEYITLNSKMVVVGAERADDSETASKQKVMLAFSYLSSGCPVGTISSYDIYKITTPRIFDYALYYNGPDGIFERFYRDYDLLLRNSLHDTKVKLLLSQTQKRNLPAHAKVVIRNVPFFFNKLKFTLGGKNEPVESEFLTTSLMEPVIEAPRINEQLPYMQTAYQWVGKCVQAEVSKWEYDNSGLDKDRTFATIYPPIPSAEHVGVPYGKQTSFTSMQTRHGTWFRKAKYSYTRTEVWLECVPK